jgi:predicted kinase
MDLAAHRRADLAALLEQSYLAAAPDADAAALMPLYLGYRALVRAAVDERAGRPDGARRHLVLAWSYARRGPPPLVVMHGMSGTGKSRAAADVAPWLRAEVLRTDVLRRELSTAGVPRYSTDETERTYRALRERAEALLRAGTAVVLDGTYLRRSRRLEVLRMARSLRAPAAVVALHAPADVVRDRLRARSLEGSDPSEATWGVYERQRTEVEAFSDEESRHVVRHGPEGSAADLVARLADLLACG